MTALDYILNGFTAELELERELGVFHVEGVALKKPPATTKVAAPKVAPAPQPVAAAQVKPEPQPVAPAPSAPAPSTTPPTKKDAAPTDRRDIVFLADRALSQPAMEMMAKIIVAMHLTLDEAPIIIHDALPPAKAYIALGTPALRKWFPNLHGVAGHWFDKEGHPEVLLVDSPEYILMLAAGGQTTGFLKQVKRRTWDALKSALPRVGRPAIVK